MTDKKEYIFNPDFVPGIVYVWPLDRIRRAIHKYQERIDQELWR